MEISFHGRHGGVTSDLAVGLPLMDKPGAKTQSYGNHLADWLDREGLRSQGVQEVEGTRIALGTTVGVVRADNQDRAAVVRYCSRRPEKSFVLLALCDGMGGMRDGGACASLALASFVVALVRGSAPSMSERMRLAVEAADQAVHRFAGGKGGSTLVGLLIDHEGKTLAIHVGDSRLYQQAGQGDTLVQLTEDDSVDNQLKQLGLLQMEAEAGESEGTIFAHQLAQFVGQGKKINAHLREGLPLNAQTGYLLTSDGVHSICRQTLDDLVFCAPSAGEAVRRLLSVSKWCQGRDNASAIHLYPGDPLPLPRSPKEHSTGFVEVWDSFGKLFTPAIERDQEQPPPARQGHAVGPDLHAGPESREAGSSEQQGQSPTRPGRPFKRARQAGAKRKQPRAQVEIVYHAN